MAEQDTAALEPKHAARMPAIRPETYDQAWHFAKLLAGSGLVPQDYVKQPEKVLTAMIMGSELGLSPMQAVQNIAVINGRPSVWGDAMLAICQAHPKWAGMKEEVAPDSMTATCTVHRKDEPPVVRTFSKQDAEAAGLWGKAGPWKQYPKRMLQMRARSWALRDAFADALRGMHSAEEVGDIIEINQAGGAHQPSNYQGRAESDPAASGADDAAQRSKGESDPAPMVGLDDNEVDIVFDVMREEAAKGTLDAYLRSSLFRGYWDQATSEQQRRIKAEGQRLRERSPKPDETPDSPDAVDFERLKLELAQMADASQPKASLTAHVEEKIGKLDRRKAEHKDLSDHLERCLAVLNEGPNGGPNTDWLIEYLNHAPGEEADAVPE